MNRVVKDDRRNKENHFNEEGPVEVVHVWVGRKKQQAGKQHHNQTAQRQKPGASGKLSGTPTSQPDTEQRKIHDGNRSYRERKPNDVDTLKNRECQRGRVEGIGDQHFST